MHINAVRKSRKGMTMMKRYSNTRSKIALMNAKASLKIEGIYFTTQEDLLLLERANGRLSNSEFLARAKEIAKNV